MAYLLLIAFKTKKGSFQRQHHTFGDASSAAHLETAATQGVSQFVVCAADL